MADRGFHTVVQATSLQSFRDKKTAHSHKWFLQVTLADVSGVLSDVDKPIYWI